jgi:vacuolar-type H+-ATPase subunit H
VPKFVDRMVGRTPVDDEADEVVHLAEVVPRKATVSRLAEYTGGQDESGQDESPQEWPYADGVKNEGDSEIGTTDYAKVGEHVASVLEAAKTAAAKITEEAREEAERLRSEAQQKGQELTQRANGYEAEKLREAEEKASAIVAGAEREVSEQTRAAQERDATLARNVAMSEERLRQLVGGLRDLAAGLEELVNDEGAGARSEDPPPSLEDSLRPSATAERTPQPPS